MMQPSERPLAVIVSLDLHGYSRLTEQDEVGTHRALMTCMRTQLEPTVRDHGGIVVKFTGDGALLCFPNSSKAVRAMMRFQHEVVETEARFPESRRLVFRVGIHAGPLIVEDDDVYGRGVNLAVRLQEMARPGNILISRDVIDQIENNEAREFFCLGKKRIKNFNDRISIYSWCSQQNTNIIRGARPALIASAMAVILLFSSSFAGSFWLSYETPGLGQQRSAAFSISDIAIVHLSDRELKSDVKSVVERFSEDLLADISDGLKTSDQREPAVPEKHPKYAIEGFFIEDSEKIRVDVGLKHGAAGGYIWRDRFESHIDEVTSLRKEIARRVVSLVDENGTISERISQNRGMNAYDAYLRATVHFDRNSPEDLREAISALQESLAWEPQYSRAHGLLAAAYWTSWKNRWPQSPEISAGKTLDHMKRHLRQVREPSAIVHAIAAEMLAAGGRHNEAIEEAEKAISLEPKSATGYYAKGLAMIFGGQLHEGEKLLRLAMQINPHGQQTMVALALVEFNNEAFGNALKTLKRAMALGSDDSWSRLLLAATYGHLYRRDDAQHLLESLERQRENQGGWPFEYSPHLFYWSLQRDLDRKRIRDGMHLAGVDQSFRPGYASFLGVDALR